MLNLLEFLAEVPPGSSSIENDTHGIEKLLLKTQVSLTCSLHSEVNKLIQHIIVQDQDGQNNKISKHFIYLIFSGKIFYFISILYNIPSNTLVPI